MRFRQSFGGLSTEDEEYPELINKRESQHRAHIHRNFAYKEDETRHQTRRHMTIEFFTWRPLQRKVVRLLISGLRCRDDIKARYPGDTEGHRGWSPTAPATKEYICATVCQNDKTTKRGK